MRSHTVPRRGLLIVPLSLLSPALAAPESFTEWRLRGEVRAPAARFVAITLAPEVFDGSERIDLSDLRLADLRGTEVPYALVREKESREEVELDGQFLNRESPTPETSRLTVDFGSSVVKNRITVVTAGDNFRRRVRVEGSADQGAWAEVLPEGWLFAVAAGQRFETLDLGANSYRYLRIAVSGMPEETRPPVIESVRCRHVIVREPQEIVRAAKLESYVTAAATRESVALADFELRHLPIARLRLLRGADPQRVFRRQCHVYGRNSLEHQVQVRFETDEPAGMRQMETPWQHLGSGTILRDASGRESLELAVETPYRYVRVVIENADSPPLEVSGIEGVLHPAHVVFEPAGESQLVLYCGNPEAPAPRYEAASTLAALDVRELQRGDLTALAAQAGARRPEAPAGQTAVWASLGAMVAATLALLWWTAVAGRKPAGGRNGVGGRSGAGFAKAP